MPQVEAFNHGSTISVIIPVYNGGTKFRKCLKSLIAAAPPPWEIIVIADGDTDGSWRVAGEYGAQLIRLPEPGGPGRARNLGAKKAKGDILFFMDADVTVSPDVIGRIRDVFHNDPDLAAVFGSYDDEPEETNFLSQYKNLFHHYIHQTSLDETSSFWGACGAIRREVFLTMGGFDEVYIRPSIEDIELGYRLKHAGYRVRLIKALQVKHLKRWGVFSLLKSDFFNRALPWTRLILDYDMLLNDLNLKTFSRMSVMTIYVLLCSLLMSIWWPWSLTLAFLLVGIMFFLNSAVYGFFFHKRGLWFTIKVIPWHWFYYLYGGFAFAVGLMRHLSGMVKMKESQ